MICWGRAREGTSGAGVGVEAGVCGWRNVNGLLSCIEDCVVVGEGRGDGVSGCGGMGDVETGVGW